MVALEALAFFSAPFGHVGLILSVPESAETEACLPAASRTPKDPSPFMECVSVSKSLEFPNLEDLGQHFLSLSMPQIPRVALI